MNVEHMSIKHVRGFRQSYLFILILTRHPQEIDDEDDDILGEEDDDDDSDGEVPPGLPTNAVRAALYI